MRLTAYLSTSRHGVFYFRWPLPATTHPERKRCIIRVTAAERAALERERVAKAEQEAREDRKPFKYER